MRVTNIITEAPAVHEPAPAREEIDLLVRELENLLPYEGTHSSLRDLRADCDVALLRDDVMGLMTARELELELQARNEARRRVALAIAGRKRAAPPPCERGEPEPRPPALPGDLSPEQHNQRIESFQRRLAKWQGA